MKAELVQVIRTEHRRGRGVQGDPLRIVVSYHLPDGTLIGEDDIEQRCGCTRIALDVPAPEGTPARG